jgi:hypothetical protein
MLKSLAKWEGIWQGYKAQAEDKLPESACLKSQQWAFPEFDNWDLIDSESALHLPSPSEVSS